MTKTKYFKVNSDFVQSVYASDYKQVVRKTWNVDEIKELLKTNDRFVLRSLIKLYSFQTNEEKHCKESTEANNKGFNKFDAKILTPIAQDVVKGNIITENQISYVRNKIMKYAKQLTKIANHQI